MQQAVVNFKNNRMRKIIVFVWSCVIAITGYSQGANRVKSGTPLRWGMNSSIEIMEGDLPMYFGTTDRAANRSYSATVENISNPHAIRFRNVQALCDNNSMQLSWAAIQQSSTNLFEVEQSDDNTNSWRVIGSVPASQMQPGTSLYNFNYYKNVPNSFLRIAAVTNSGERLYSTIFESPCSENSFLSLTPNPVYSSTTLRIGSPTAAKLRLLLVDTRGSVVQNHDVTILQGSNNLSLDMNDLPRGYYTLAIQWMSGKQNILNLLKQ